MNHDPNLWNRLQQEQQEQYRRQEQQQQQQQQQQEQFRQQQQQQQEQFRQQEQCLRQEQERRDQDYRDRQNRDYWDRRSREQEEQEHSDRMRRPNAATGAGEQSSGRFNYSTGSNISDWSFLLWWLVGILLLALVATAPYLAITAYHLGGMCFRYYLLQTVLLFAAAIPGSRTMWPATSSGGATEARGRRPRGGRLKTIWLLSALAAPLGLSVWTFFSAPPLEVAVAKMNTRFTWWYKEPHFLFNPEDFKGTGEEGVRRLLREIENPDAKLDLVVQGLIAIGPSGENALRSDGVRRLLQEIENPKADLALIGQSLQAIGAPADTLRTEGIVVLRKRLREDDKSYPEVLAFCRMFGEPLFPVLRDMASSKHPASELVWNALRKLDVGTPGLESFVPEVLNCSVYFTEAPHMGAENNMWGGMFREFMRKHAEAIDQALQSYQPIDQIEMEGKRVALKLIRVDSVEGDPNAFYALRQEVMDRMYQIQRGLPLPPLRGF